MPIPSEIVLFGFLIIAAVMVVIQKNLLAAAMLTGIFSLLSACLFTLMDAVDVAFTEAAVGAGISTVLFLATLALTDREERQQPARLFPFLVVLLTGIALVIGTLDMAPYGSKDAPIHTEVTAKIIKVEYEALVRNSKHEPVPADAQYEQAVGLPNIVTSVLGSYRGYDTLGETGVIFTAGIGVMLLLLGRRRESPEIEADEDAVTSVEPPSLNTGAGVGEAATLDMVEPIALTTESTAKFEDATEDDSAGEDDTHGGDPS